MPQIGYDDLVPELKTLKTQTRIGRIAEIAQTHVRVTGLGDICVAGDLVRFHSPDMCGEVLSLSNCGTIIVPDGGVRGLAMNAPVFHLGEAKIAPHDSWLGRVISPYGQPLDGKPLLRGAHDRGFQNAAPAPTQRRGFGPRLSTGLSVLNTFLPIVRGQRIGLFAGAGVGKSTLLSQLATRLETDVVVLALIGERGREVRDFIEHALGPKALKRCVILCATADQPATLRRRCALAAMSVAEHFRDAGQNVLLLMDSITRFAQAHREIQSALGETADLGGYPPSTAQALTALSERAGTGVGDSGDITAVFSVLVAGSDMDEPIADIMRGVLDGHIILDRKIAERGRFPAIDLLRSVSRALPNAAPEEENALIATARRHIATYERSELMIQSGLYGQGSDPNIDTAISLWPALDKFMSTRNSPSIAHSFDTLREILESASPQ